MVQQKLNTTRKIVLQNRLKQQSNIIYKIKENLVIYDNNQVKLKVHNLSLIQNHMVLLENQIE